MTAAESRADAAESKVVIQQEQIASIGEKLDGSRKVVLTLQEKTNVMALELKKTVAVVAKRREVEIKLTEEANQLLVTLSDMETRTKRDRRGRRERRHTHTFIHIYIIREKEREREREKERET